MIRVRRNPWSRVTSAALQWVLSPRGDRQKWMLTLACGHVAWRRVVPGKLAPRIVRCEKCGNPGGAK